MENFILILHNLLRWLVLAAALYAIIRAVKGLVTNAEFGNQDNKAGMFLTIIADVQLLLGFVLFFTSTIIKTGLQDFGGSMSNPEIRMYLLEHPLAMIFAIVLFHIGKSKVKKAADSTQKHKKALIFYGLGLIIILSRIPWSADRLLRWF
ncbi:MAG: hypothetical protein ACI8ZN_001388 [Bacteroidia bacterium]|jgi:hypothetical protein